MRKSAPFQLGHHNPLLWRFIALAAGVVLARAAGFIASEIAMPALAFAVMYGVALRKRRPLGRFAALFAVLCAAGVALVLFHAPAPAPQLSVPDGQLVELEGCVVEPGLTAADREKFLLELASGARAQVSLYVREGQSFPSLPYGTLVRFPGKLRTPHNYNNPGSFDFVHYLGRQHIFWSASGNAETLQQLPGRCGSLIPRAIFAIRMASLDRLDHLYAADDYTNGMMQALLLGATAKLERKWTEDYRSTGTFHALVISGGHVAVLVAVLLFILRLLGVPKGAASIAAIALAWLYAGVTGWQAPVLRSAAGMTVFGLGRIFYRDGRLLNVLAAVAICFVLLDPEQIFDASFQLSFLAVALIGAFVIPAVDATSAPLREALRELQNTKLDLRLPPRIAQFRIELRLLSDTLHLFGLPVSMARFAFVGSLAAVFFLWELSLTSFFIQLGLALPSVAYFHRLAISGLSANAVVVPVLSIVVPLGFLAIGLNSTLLAGLCTPLMSIAQQTASLHARWEPNFRIPSPPLWLAIAFAVSLFVAACARKWWQQIVIWPAVVVALIAIAFHPFPAQLIAGQFELDDIDVGQGDSLLAAFPRGALVLIDAGGIPTFNRKRKPNLDIGEDVVSTYLWSRSIKRLDVIAMTHAHEDHMGGMPAVIRNFRPRELWTGAVPESPEWDTVRAAANQYGVTIRPLAGGQKFAYAGATVEVLAPARDYEPGPKPKNNDSLVLRIRYGSTSFLLTGDAEKQIEQQLVAEGLAPSTVLKVGHHGSRTSSTVPFLDAVHPAIGLISAGWENSYGHPHPLTLQALEDRHVEILRTDQRGLIRILSDGTRLSLP